MTVRILQAQETARVHHWSSHCLFCSFLGTQNCPLNKANHKPAFITTQSATWHSATLFTVQELLLYTREISKYPTANRSDCCRFRLALRLKGGCLHPSHFSALEPSLWAWGYEESRLRVSTFSQVASRNSSPSFSSALHWMHTWSSCPRVSSMVSFLGN